MKSIYLIAILFASTQGLTLNRLDREGEARAIENAIVNRVVPNLDSAEAHPDDPPALDMDPSH